jgi:Tfp pilus assembly protein PilX
VAVPKAGAAVSRRGTVKKLLVLVLLALIGVGVAAVLRQQREAGTV